MKENVQISITSISILITVVASVLIGIGVWANIPRGVHIKLNMDDPE